MTVAQNLMWAIRLPAESAGYLGPLRLVPSVNVLVQDRFVWLRGNAIDPDLQRRLRSIPAAEWFNVWPGELLTSSGQTVPCDRLPAGTWQALNQWIDVQMPPVGFAAASHVRVMLKLIRSSRPTVANMLLAAWNTWRDYALSAPLVRLNRWGFALSDQDTVVIRGLPLPPIPGCRLSESHGVILPAGWEFDPAVGAKVARQVLQLDDSELALFSEDSSFQRIPVSAFVQATRSAVRMSHG